MSSAPEPPRLRREVSPLELFYDLVFVFAVSQLSHHLLEHLTWRGAAETAVLLVAVFGVWAYTSIEATLLDVNRLVTRSMIVVAMGIGVFMNAAITHAFEDRSWAFVVPLLLTLILAGAVTAVSGRVEAQREHFRRTLVWMLTSAPLWIVGAAVDPGPRLWWWAAAALIDVTGTWLAHPLPGRRLSGPALGFDNAHMTERFRLFFIILLGETVLSAGRVMSDAPFDAPHVLATAGVFIALVCLWAFYFGGGEDVFNLAVATTADPMRLVRMALNGTYVVMAALVALAVGSDLAIAHPLDDGSGTLALLLFGGPALYLAVTAWFFRATAHGAWTERLLGFGACVLGGVAAVWLPALASLAVLDVILVVTAAALIRSHRALARSLKAAAEG